jgi:hypothetical protein
MRSMRVLIGAVALAAVAVGSVGCAGTSGEGRAVVEYAADYPAYDTAKQIVQASELIVRGVTVGQRVEQMRPEISTEGDPAANPQAGLSAEEAERVPPVIVTISTVRVVETIKGSVRPGELVEVSQLGGEFQGTKYAEADTRLLSTTDTAEYVLLLAGHGPGKPYDLLNPAQAMFKVEAGEQLNSVASEGSLGTWTLDELRAEASRQ